MTKKKSVKESIQLHAKAITQFFKKRKVLTFTVSACIVLGVVSVGVLSYQHNQSVQLANIQAQEEAERHAAELQAAELRAQQDLLEKQESQLSELGIEQDDLDDATPTGTVSGTCKSGGGTVEKGVISVNILRDGSWTCATYKMDDLKDYETEDGSVVNGSVNRNERGHGVTNIQTKDKDGTNHVNTGYQTEEGGMAWGGTGFEKCFGPNSTVCTMVDDLGEHGDGGASFISMVQSCFLVSTGDGHWRIGTASELAGRKNPNTSSFAGSCASWKSYKNLFYNK